MEGYMEGYSDIDRDSGVVIYGTSPDFTISEISDEALSGNIAINIKICRILKCLRLYD